MNILSAKIKHEPVRAQLNERVLNKSVVINLFQKFVKTFRYLKIKC